MRFFIVFIPLLIVNLTYAQDTDKLTVKGGVMLGTPRFESFDYKYDRRGMYVYPKHEGRLSFNNTTSLFAGVEYFPWKIKLSKKGTYLLPFTSLNFCLYSTKYDYKGGDIYNREFEGAYNIVSLLPSMSLGVKISIEKYKMEILASTDLLFIEYLFREKVIKHDYNTDVSYYNHNDDIIRKLSYPKIELVTPGRFQLDFRYKLNPSIAVQLGFASSYLGKFNSSNIIDTPVGHSYYGLYHQISLGLTYKLLSHKNKTEQNIE
jgi:hypothetical protein